MYNVNIVRGDGSYLIDENGRKILDFANNFGTNTLGYSSSIIEKATIQQIHQGIFSQSEKIPNKNRKILSEKLCEIAGFTEIKNGQKNNNGSVFFCNSRSEANELAIKLARKRYNTLCDRDYNEIICFKNSNHGNSLTTMSASNDKYISQFAPKMHGFKFAEINNIKSVEKLICEHTCAIMIEPIQYINGVCRCDEEFIKKIRQLCDIHEIVLIFDETHCGSGRTGTFFAYEDYNIKPDIVTISGGFSGGLPLSACIFNNTFFTFASQIKTHALSGNALLYNIANNVVDRINNKNILLNVKKQEKILKIYLERLWRTYKNAINNFNIKGLMFSIQIREDVNCETLVKILLTNGLLVEMGGNNNILCFPPLNISEQQIEKAMKIIAICIEIVAVVESY